MSNKLDDLPNSRLRDFFNIHCDLPSPDDHITPNLQFIFNQGFVCGAIDERDALLELFESWIDKLSLQKETGIVLTEGVITGLKRRLAELKAAKRDNDVKAR